MTKDFEARAKQREAFETEWEFQQGSLMLKNVHEGKEWKRVVADWFFQQGAKYGREAGLDEGAEIAVDKGKSVNGGYNNAAWEIAEAIRAAKGKP